MEYVIAIVHAVKRVFILVILFAMIAKQDGVEQRTIIAKEVRKEKLFILFTRYHHVICHDR